MPAGQGEHQKSAQGLLGKVTVACMQAACRGTTARRTLWPAGKCIWCSKVCRTQSGHLVASRAKVPSRCGITCRRHRLASSVLCMQRAVCNLPLCALHRRWSAAQSAVTDCCQRTTRAGMACIAVPLPFCCSLEVDLEEF